MNSPLHIALVVLACFFGVSLPASAQTPERTKAVRQAGKLADDRQYVEAIRVLELAMLEGDTSEALVVDLSGYYKKTGDLRMATSLCLPLVNKERPRPWHLLEVSRMLVDQGRLREAEPYLRRFEELKPLDRRAAALREYALSRKRITGRYPHARLDTFVHNTPADDGFPTMAGDVVYWSSDRQSEKSKRSGWTGRAMVSLYRAEVDTEDGGFGEADRVDARFNRGLDNTACPALSPDGQRLYFSSNAKTPNRLGDLNMQLYYAERKDNGGWGAPERVAGQFEEANCMHPAIGPDGDYLYFAADASESRGGLDVYRVAILPGGGFGRPENLGPEVNTERHDAFPSVGPDGELYFASQGHVSLGGFDVFAVRPAGRGKWTAAENLGEPVNSEGDETGWVPVREGRAWLVSDREGGDDDVYEVRY